MLDEQEREYWRSKFREEIEAQAASRPERGKDARLAVPPTEEHEERQRVAELARLRQEVQKEVLQELGYKPYKDSRGFVQYLPPEEHERREKRHGKKRRKKKWSFVESVGYESFFLYLGIGVFALAVVLALAR